MSDGTPACTLVARPPSGRKKGSEMEVCVDRARCTGHAECVDLVPDVFQLDETGEAVVIGGVSLEAHSDRLRLAVMLCPANAITFVEG